MAFYRGGHWYTDFVVRGQRYPEVTDITDHGPKGEAKAKKLQAQRKALVLAKVAEAEQRTVRDGRGKILDEPIHDAFAFYYGNHAIHAKGKGPQNILWQLAYAEAHFGPETPISHIDFTAMIGLREKRRRDTSRRCKTPMLISARAVNITLETVKFALSWLKRNGRAVTEIDWRNGLLLEVEDRETAFTTAHEGVLLEHFRSDMLPCLLFMLEVGPRKRQAVSLTWSDVDWNAHTVRLIKQKKRGARRNPKPHYVPMTKEVEALLRSQIDPATGQPYHPEQVWTYVGQRSRTEVKSGREIVAGQRYPITYEGLTTQWVAFKERHGLKNVRIHDLRHAAATTALAATGNLALVRDLLGHSDIKTTERYAHTSVTMLREALDRRVHNGRVPA